MTRRADRLFDIVQSLRAAARPMTAAALADHLAPPPIYAGQALPSR